MARTPKGFLTKQLGRNCFCHPTQAEKLFQLAEQIRRIFGPTITIREALEQHELHYPDEPLTEWDIWAASLALDFSRATPDIAFRAIMEDHDRATILRNLRKRGETKL